MPFSAAEAVWPLEEGPAWTVSCSHSSGMACQTSSTAPRLARVDRAFFSGGAAGGAELMEGRARLLLRAGGGGGAAIKKEKVVSRFSLRPGLANKRSYAPLSATLAFCLLALGAGLTGAFLALAFGLAFGVAFGFGGGAGGSGGGCWTQSRLSVRKRDLVSAGGHLQSALIRRGRTVEQVVRVSGAVPADRVDALYVRQEGNEELSKLRWPEVEQAAVFRLTQPTSTSAAPPSLTSPRKRSGSAMCHSHRSQSTWSLSPRPISAQGTGSSYVPSLLVSGERRSYSLRR